MAWFTDERFAQLVVDQLLYYEGEYEFRLDTYCVMPDHYHAVLREEGRKNISQILHAVNSYIVTSIGRDLDSAKKPKIFHGNPWVEGIKDENMYWQKIAYTLFNPWRGGKVTSPLDPYQFSDIGRWIEGEGVGFLEDLFSQYRRWYE